MRKDEGATGEPVAKKRGVGEQSGVRSRGPKMTVDSRLGLKVGASPHNRTAGPGPVVEGDSGGKT